MVPDVAYNEAYISFIFTHPEWRQAGIGSFLLYHLIQVSRLFTQHSNIFFCLTGQFLQLLQAQSSTNGLFGIVRAGLLQL